MKKTKTPPVPPRLLRLLGNEVESHLRPHLTAEHLPLGQRAQARTAKPQRTNKQRKTDLLTALPIHSASSGALAGSGLGSLQPNGWLLLVDSAPGVVAMFELQEQGQQALITRVSSGELPEQVKKAVQRAGRYKGVQLRALRVPAMHLLAVWCHFPKKRSKGFVTPVTRNFSGLGLQRSYTYAKAEHTLKRTALGMILRWYDRVEREMQERRSGQSTRGK